jgi:hypothetical protein
MQVDLKPQKLTLEIRHQTVDRHNIHRNICSKAVMIRNAHLKSADRISLHDLRELKHYVLAILNNA